MRNIETKNNKKSKITIILILIILVALVSTIIAVSPNDSSFSIDFYTMGTTKNIFCDKESAHMCIDTDGDGVREYAPSWYYTRSSTDSYSNDKKAYILADAYTNRTSASYGDKYQTAWWNGTSDAAEAFAEYRKNAKTEITNLKRNSSTSISFTISGGHNDTYGLGELVNAQVYDVGKKEIVKTVTNIKYGANTIEGIDAYSVKVKINYKETTASGNVSYYTTDHYWNGSNNVYPSGGGQPLVVFSGSFGSNDKSTSWSDEVKLKTNVSLQKYIVKVENEDKGVTYDADSRKNKFAAANSDLYSEGSYNHEGKDISKNNNKSGANKYKSTNPVEIEFKDTVTYKIVVYNNSNVSTKVTIKDIWNSKYGTMLDAGGLSLEKVDGNSTKYKSSEFSLNGGEEKVFYIKIKYDKQFTENVIRNKSWISETEITNDTNYRTIDADYIKMKKVNVSLQKYIIGVNGNLINDTNNPEYNTTLTNRHNTYSNESETDEKAKKHPSKNNSATSNYKRSNVVEVEVGDSITYRVYVYNNTDVKAHEVVVKDKLLYYGSTQYDNYTIEKITRDGNNTDIKVQWTAVANTSPTEYQYTITNLAGNSETYFDITVKLNTYLSKTVITNTAYIDSTVPTNDTPYRTLDRDYIKMKDYKVSLQKIVSSVNGSSTGDSRWESWESNANKNDSPKNETYNRDNLYAKHNNPETVTKGDYVTYAIRVKNDGKTKVSINTVKDILPEGLSEYKIGDYNSSGKYESIPNDRTLYIDYSGLLNPGETKTLYVTARVSESNMSTRLLRNYAEILNNDLTNKNGIGIKDTTTENNQDADYIQLKDIIISGTVWNDKALDKKQDNYNGVYEEGEENKLSGIKVSLYRDGKGVIATTRTDENGNYTFDKSKIDTKIVTEQCERYIKAPYTCADSAYTGNVKHGANYWKENAYYSYYVVFEYDGITYTSTICNDVTSENNKDSNAKEDNGQTSKTRKQFNDSFSTINKDKGINYTTKNEDGYLPQSNHIYDENTMGMESSTSKITLSNTVSLEERLTHVNLGLRGRDVFDLELMSDVYSTKIKVNGQEGEYNYNANKVTVRKSDISVAEDTANFANELRESSITDINQTVRDTDISKDKANKNAKEKYDQTGLAIEVTYKITVNNASRTQGTASKIVNYYDNKYEFKGAYAQIGGATLSTTNGKTGEGYKSVIITTPGTKLNQSEKMDIYVVYELKNPTSTLDELIKGEKSVKTYNMAEIYEYKTYTTNNNEATRGLIDKDSAPGSAETEKVRLTTGSSENTTVEYYFNKKLNENKNNEEYLKYLKYEDDTYATPTLYFTSTENGRKLSGVVFRDSTTTDAETRIKTGNGIKDEGEVGVYGAKVELVEGNKVRYITTTNEKGEYTFSDFLPGNYEIVYSYGDNKNSVLLKQSGEINEYSFNGEDYQSTNNIGVYGANKLNDTDKVWYAYNEKDGISTATDNEERRNKVTDNVTNFTDEEMTVLNNIRDGKSVSDPDVEKIIKDTYMFATTPGFTLSVEKTETDKDNKNPTQKVAFSEYEVTNMNFGISEVPVTTIDLQKEIAAFTIKDSTGNNTIASAVKEGNEWTRTGDVIPMGNTLDVSIEDEKLQGSKLEVTFNVLIDMTTEKDFRNKEITIPTIDGIVDYVDNDLSYNEALGENSKYWTVDSYDNIKRKFALSKYKNDGTIPQGTVDSEGKKYTTVLTATEANPILLKTTGKASCPITLEKTLSSTESTIENIIISSIDTYEYSNTVEILKLDYTNTTKKDDGGIEYRDRVRTPERYIILAGTQHDSATSGELRIHPPTGNNNSMIYYVIAVTSLAVLAIGTFGIKKIVVKSKE